MFSGLKPYLQSRFEVYHGVGDLFTYFYERGLRLLKPGGRLGFISSNTFFKTGSGKPLRDYLLREATIEGVVDFGDLQIFEGVTTYPAILTMKRGAAPKGHELRFWKVDALPEANFQATWEAAAGPYPQSALGAGSWELEPPALRVLRDKIRTGRSTLKDVYGSPLYGIKTGLNEAFVIDSATKERLCAEDPRSAELLKPFLEGKDLKRWRAEPRGLWLIKIEKGWTRSRFNTSDEALAWASLSINYPPIADWLLQFAASAQKRTDKGEFWWELRACAYYEKVEAAKVLYPEFCDKPQFQLNTSHYFNNKCYFVSTQDNWLAAYLNSKLGWFVITEGTVPVRGGFHQMHSQFIEQVVLPAPSKAEQDRLGELVTASQLLAGHRLEKQSALTRRICDLCPVGRDPKLSTRLQEWWTLPDFASFRAEVEKVFKADIPLVERSSWEDWITRDRAEIARLSAEITKAEAQIDRIVYGLFDLNPDEIALLESAV